MKVALYHPWIYLTSGIERGFVEIIRRSRHDWTLFTHHFAPDSTYPELSDARVVALEPGVSVQRSLLPLLAASRTIARTRLPLDGQQSLLVSSEGLGDFVLAKAELPAVCWCHTPLKILHDPVASATLREQSRAKWAASRLLAPAFTTADRRMWRHYRHIAANSAETKQRIVAAGLAEASDVEIVYAGVDLERFAPDAALQRHHFLVAGRIMWQKNIELAIDALRLTDLAVPMVIAGAVDEKSKPYLAALRQRAEGLPVSFVVNPSDKELTDLYDAAVALVFTPANEDFGIVPLEAMAAGAPVIAVNRGGPTETVLDGRTGWLAEPTAAAFAARMNLLATMPALDADVLRRAAVARAAEFSWQAFVDRIDELMQSAAEQPRL